MALQGEVWGGLPNAPHLNGAVQGCAGKGVRILGIEGDLHLCREIVFQIGKSLAKVKCMLQ